MTPEIRAQSETENSLLTDFENLEREKKLADVMESGPPIIDVEANIEVVKDLLRHYSCVLTVKNGETSGLITKADLLKKL